MSGAQIRSHACIVSFVRFDVFDIYNINSQSYQGTRFSVRFEPSRSTVFVSLGSQSVGEFCAFESKPHLEFLILIVVDHTWIIEIVIPERLGSLDPDV